ncbi:hypothetical protein [Primorskyibacter sp. 2E233]|uniref:hypothetical protein n=1 Tax=Primorskyibacter sp. 2E233 TaxID=3413431 RepID=UPI003BF0AE89
MRDFFAILVIALAVVALGVFQVPNEDALVAAGIKAGAEGAVYQARHPLSIAVEGRVVTVSGRVESEDEGAQVIARLAALQGVEEVVSGLVILPTIAPFDLRMQKRTRGVSVSGYVPDSQTAEAISEVFALDETPLTVAVGAPDAAWGEVALSAAQALAGAEEGDVLLSDAHLTFVGVMHLPEQVRQIEAGFAQLPEGYSADLKLTALDDGLPYGLLVTRDPYMGVRLSGKLPPDYDLRGLSVLDGAFEQVYYAPKPLDVPGFEQALAAAVPMIAELPQGAVSIAPGVVSVQGGPIAQKTIEKIAGMALPQGYALNLSLIPVDDGPALSLHASWDGQALAMTGRVPSDFDAEALVAPMGMALGKLGLDRGLYPDLQDWQAPLRAGFAALKILRNGELSYGVSGLHLSGLAANPAARQQARAVLGGAGQSAIQLADDGAPAVFELTYDPAIGAAVQGKLPAGLTPQAMGEALGGLELRGDPRVAPQGDGGLVLSALRAVQPYLSLLDGMRLTYSPEAIALELEVTPGGQFETLSQRLALPSAVQLSVARAKPPLSGTQRTHVLLDQPQVFQDGYWLPQVRVKAGAQACTEAMDKGQAVPFAQARFAPALGAVHPLAYFAAVARACTWTGDLRLRIQAEAGLTEYPALNRQLARRRAEALRGALADRGVPRGRIDVSGAAAGPEGERVTYIWQ